MLAAMTECHFLDQMPGSISCTAASPPSSVLCSPVLHVSKPRACRTPLTDSVHCMLHVSDQHRIVSDLVVFPLARRGHLHVPPSSSPMTDLGPCSLLTPEIWQGTCGGIMHDVIRHDPYQYKTALPAHSEVQSMISRDAPVSLMHFLID